MKRLLNDDDAAFLMMLYGDEVMQKLGKTTGTGVRRISNSLTKSSATQMARAGRKPLTPATESRLRFGYGGILRQSLEAGSRAFLCCGL